MRTDWPPPDEGLVPPMGGYGPYWPVVAGTNASPPTSIAVIAARTRRLRMLAFFWDVSRAFIGDRFLQSVVAGTTLVPNDAHDRENFPEGCIDPGRFFVSSRRATRG